MVASIAQLIGAINPDKYASFSDDKSKGKKELAELRSKKWKEIL